MKRLWQEAQSNSLAIKTDTAAEGGSVQSHNGAFSRMTILGIGGAGSFSEPVSQSFGSITGKISEIAGKIGLYALEIAPNPVISERKWL